MKKKTHVQYGDKVVVIAGNHRGKEGKIITIDSKKERVVVEGVRKIKKAVKKSEQNPEGGIEEKDGSIHISNVKKVS